MSQTQTEVEISAGQQETLETEADKKTSNGEENAAESNEEVCEVLDEESNVSQVSDVITVDDAGDNVIPSKTVPDVVFFESVSEEEKKYYIY